ncbi:PREDICTED: tumor necrosis factor-like [Thamnophis sirtalis]|uniref:Tumor necrosis factor n=1 Tax=Thamnophis sirtalis TaxID=35019 RepID=A0A6I9Y0U7_9SAUR|nr:PREDICTED: tumor necrosis factor-like [Thamnophis sirtalis]XP_032066978.1 tumor necrosis factor [Thamnophis elegans]
MSSEQLVRDVEKGNIVVIREPAQKNNHWKCLSICSFLLLIGAVTVFALLQLDAFGSSGNQDSKVQGNSFSDHLPATMKVQALRSRKPAAHAVASSHNTKELNWTTDVIPTFLENGMQLDKSENSFVVPSTGLYFIYSQLLFHKDNCKTPLLLTHSIVRRSSEISVEVELLKSIKSVCEQVSSNKKLWFESIYQGGVFHLNQGARLWSKTNHPEYLDFTHSAQIYFGVIAM